MDIDERYNKMNNRPNWKSYVFVVLVCFLTYKFLPIKTYRQVTNQEVELWKNKLLQVYFKGEVMSININDNHERLSRTIYLKILDTANVIIPDSCEYFKLQKGMLLLTAANLNISTYDLTTKLKKAPI